MTTTIGIDPGQRTGVAIYRDGKLCELRTVSLADIDPARSKICANDRF